MVATALFVSVILSTQFSFAEMLARIGAVTHARWQAARTAWAHFVETRRKERMRREVIKKHTQKEREKEPLPPDAVPKVRKVKAAPGAESTTTTPRATCPSAPVRRRSRCPSR